MQTLEKAPEFLFGGGEMGELIRNFDWSKTPLGAPEHWDQSLKTCVRIMLTSSQPIWIGWGKELIKLYNDPYKAIVGGKHPQALGQPASVVWKDIWKDIEPMLKQVMEKDEGTYVESQLLIMERYGYPEETYYTFSYSPVPGDNGGTAGMICYNTADTERIITERSLKTLKELGALSKKKKPEEVYTAAAEVLKANNKDFPCAVIYKIDEEKRIASAFGFAGIDKDHPELPETINLDTPGTTGQNLSKAVIENTMVVSNTATRWKNLPTGYWSVMPKQFVHIPISGANKKYPLAVLSAALNPYRKFDDVYKNFVQLIADQISLEVNNVLALEEERRRAEALAEIDKAKTLFFTNISHEFRTPLTLMLGPIEEALKDPDSIPDNIARLDVAHRNAIRLLKLVNTLLDFSRIESGRQKANFVFTDIVAFTKNLASNFRSVIEKAGLQLTVRAGNSIPAVYIDREMWEKIVFNLLSNAFKYTLKGSIDVHLSAENNQAVLRVKDTGAGIPESELPHIFERFHRVQNTTGRSFEGTGIGLSLTKELVQLHGGNISVESKPGAGSIFTVFIPLGKKHLQAEQITAGKDDLINDISAMYVEEAVHLIDSISAKNKTDVTHLQNKNEKHPLIMIVDDNADMRIHIETLLSLKFKTVTAKNGLDAMNKIKEFAPDLILSDIMMPVMDGIELLKTVKTNNQTENIPVILLTARAGEESKIEGWETGADDYLVKPFSSKELIARIEAQIKITKKRRAAEKQLHDLFIQAPTAIQILKGPEFIYELVNERSLELMGQSKEEVIGRRVIDVMPEAAEQGLISLLERVYNTGERYIAEEAPVYQTRNGKKIEMFTKFVFEPLRDDEGMIKGIMITGDDVTAQVLARKKIEESEMLVRKSEERYVTTVNASDLGLWDFDIASKKMVAAGKMAEIFGVDSNEEMKLQDIFDCIHPEDKKAYEALYYSIINKKIDSSFSVEYRIITKNTQEEKWIRAKGKAFFDEDGKPYRTVGTIADITAQKMIEEKIRESEERFRTLAETLPQMVWMLNDEGEIEYGSKNWETYSGIKNVREAWKAMVHPEDWKTVMNAWKHDSASGKPFRYDVRLKNKEGEYRWHYASGEPVTDKSGHVIKWLGALTDIHVQKTFAEKLEQEVTHRTQELLKANKELDAFNYIASHDLQEPLRKIQTFITLIQKNNADYSLSQKYFEKIKSSAQRMSELIQSILSYSRLSKSDDDCSPTDLNKILNDVINDFELLIKEKNATIKNESLPIIQANTLQMHQLFSNLISNALKFSKDTPEITITSKIITGNEITWNGVTDAKQKFVQLTFSDNGIGFNPEFKQHIFQLFQRLHNKQEYSGTGIGLSIVKKIVDRHNGYVSADSIPGNGATFNVCLPLL